LYFKERVNNDTPLSLIFKLIGLEKTNVKYLYIYAIFSGLISLAIPLGIQSIIGYVMAGRLNTSWFLLAVAISTFVLFAGLTRLAQISIIDSLQRRLFLFFGERFKTRLMSTKTMISDEKTVLYFLDITTLQKSLSKLLVDFSGKLLQAFFGLLLLSIYHPLFLIFGGIVLLVVYSVIRLTWKRGFQTARLESNFKFETAMDLLNLNREAVDNSKLTAQIDRHINNYATFRTSHFGIIYRQAWLGIITKVVFTAFMLIIGSYLLVEQSISLGQFLAAEILIITMLDAIEKLILTVENLYDCGIAAEKLDLISREDD